MRAIKFRGWNGKEILNDVFNVTKNPAQLFKGVPISAQCVFSWSMSSVQDVMQFTGLLDKNGVEIYENSEIDNEFVVATKGCDYVLINISSGDILRLQDYYSGARGNVKVTREYAGIPEDTKRRTN